MQVREEDLPQNSGDSGIEVAVIGLAGRFPGAQDVDAFWRNIRDGVESVSTSTDAQLRERGIPQAVLDDPAYVKAGVLFGSGGEGEGFDRFDAAFFGYPPREAEQLDPQQRFFLECAWQALEHAGYDAERVRGAVGVYAGAGANLYLMRHLLPRLGTGGIAELIGLLNGNSADSLSTRVAYKLNLRGPAVTVQTACSTSLTAVHMACQALLSLDCDMALCGGVWLNLLQDGGYRHQSGAILSSDGHCRAFDAAADGTVLGSGCGVVVLKRLDDARRDRDTIHAVIKGSAANNDGAAKVGYTAPSVEGQAAVIRAAHVLAGVSADTIGYVEAHGTGTTLGDPIEVAALTLAFRATTDRRNYCALGSVKTNIGHLDAAAGVAGLIKAVLALEHRTLAPSLNFRAPNPNIDFAASPFRIDTEARPWPAGATPRRAGVSSFGMGGTNVHVVLEEAPVAPPAEEPHHGGVRLLVLSARSPGALDAAAQRLADHVERCPEQTLGDIAHTLAAGRKRFAQRAVAVVHDRDSAVQALRSQAAPQYLHGAVLSDAPSVAFLFAGQGAQHVGMARCLYEREPVFRDTVDRCCEALARPLGLDLRGLIYPATNSQEGAAQLAQTAVTQPALFVIAYAMARLWTSWGVRPDAMLGHSLGEYVAACLAGVFTLDEALALVAARGRLLEATEPGAMLAVGQTPAQLQPWLDAGCDLAAVNAADLCVLSGPLGAITTAERELAARGVAARRLPVSRAFHSALLDPVLGEFEAQVRRVALREPVIPFVSNLSGRWITPEEACSPGYWVAHLRGTVRFADGLDTLLEKADRIPLEVGPGAGLSSLVKRHPKLGTQRPALASQVHPQRQEMNADQPARCLARLWIAGLDLPETAFAGASDGARRVPLPTYPFERQSYWVASGTQRTAEPAPAQGGRELDDWFHAPRWRRAEPIEPLPASAGLAVLFGGPQAWAHALARHLEACGCRTVRLEGRFAARLDDKAEIARALQAITAELGPITTICHLQGIGLDGSAAAFYSLLALAQALENVRAAGAAGAITLTVVADRLEDVTGSEPLLPERALLHGPCKVIPQELPHVACRLIDIEPFVEVVEGVEAIEGAGAEASARAVAAEILSPSKDPVIALRGPHRWVKVYERVRRDAPARQRLRKGGVYLVTGGLGGIGLTLAEHLARRWQARLVLVGRSALPEPRAWEALERAGAQVLVARADVCDAGQIKAVVELARQRFGELHGVIHAAGVPGGELLAHRQREAVDQVLAPKLQGTRALLAALAQLPLDFVLLCSSLSSVAGGLGSIDYAAANAYLDAVAALERRGMGRPVFAVNWDGWRGVGMTASLALPDGVGILPAQGVEIFERIVNGPVESQTCICTTDLQARLRAADGGALLALAQQAPPAPARPAGHPRPSLPTAYAAPEGELESALAAMWSEFLGVAPIGKQDNLFELGGDSLLALQLLARAAAAYGVEIHPAALYHTPTVGALAQLIEQRLIDQIEAEPAAA